MTTLAKARESRKDAAHDDDQPVLALRERAQRILETEIDMIPNPAFDEVDFEGGDEQIVQASLHANSSGAPRDLPAHLRAMCESDLLDREQEQALFCRMNWLKHQALKLRDQLCLDEPDGELIAQIEKHLEVAQQIRDHIIQANMRLVISIVKKYVTPQQSFDDMLSDGAFTLMQAVEKFDYDRGFRFSTYAYRSIARGAYRAINSAREEQSRFARDVDEWAFESEDESSSSMTDQVWGNLRSLTADMLERLDRRERLIIRSRYALGAHRKVRTFQSLADRLGVSKERVRQLEQRAVAKLRKMAGEFDMDELFSAAMV